MGGSQCGTFMQADPQNQRGVNLHWERMLTRRYTEMHICSYKYTVSHRPPLRTVCFCVSPFYYISRQVIITGVFSYRKLHGQNIGTVCCD